MLQAFVSFLLFPTLFAFLVFPLFPIGFWVRLRNSNLQYKELTSGFDLNNALGRYRSSNNDVIASLINVPSNFYNSGEITIDWFPAGDNNTFGVQIIRGRYANTTYQYIRSKARNEWRSWEQFALKSDLNNIGMSMFLFGIGNETEYSFHFQIIGTTLTRPPVFIIIGSQGGNRTAAFPITLTASSYVDMPSTLPEGIESVEYADPNQCLIKSKFTSRYAYGCVIYPTAYVKIWK